MYGLETINAMNDEAARKARKAKKAPVCLKSIEDFGVKPFPNLGDACDDFDKKFELIEDLFCDASGFGAPYEPALTQDQLKIKLGQLIDEHGPVLCAIRSVGQFQLYLAVWKADS
jgi:hypothetical protein